MKKFWEVPRIAAAVAAAVVASGGAVFGMSSAASAATYTVVFGFGDDTSGQLGNVPENSVTGQTADPQPVLDFAQNVRQIATNGRTTAVVHSDGTVWTFGSNTFDLLGDGSPAATLRTLPAQVPGLSNIVQVSMADSHALAVAADGTVWAWGNNASGDLGDGKTQDQEPFAPTPVRATVAPSGVAQVAAGGAAFSVVLRSNGEVWAWGNNTDGELGNGTFADSLTAVRVSVPYGITQISAGSFSSMALRSLPLGGAVYAWGANNVGQLGVPTSTVVSNVGVRVGGQAVANITQIGSGELHGVALQNDGSVWTWGSNDSGQLGDNGPNTFRETPAKLTALSGVTAIAAGGRQNAAVTPDGSLWNWGNFLVHQDATTPYRVNAPIGATQLAVGNRTVLFSVPAPSVVVPNFLGQPFDSGLQAVFNGKGLALAVSTQVDPTCANLGTIISEVPAGLSLVPVGTTVSLVYLVAPAAGCTTTVPNLVGDTVAQATGALSAAGLVLGRQFTTNTIDCGVVNKIESQSQAPGSVVARGTSVDVTVFVLTPGKSCG